MDQPTTPPVTTPNEFEQAKAIGDQQVKDYIGEKEPPKPNPVEQAAADHKETPKTDEKTTTSPAPALDTQKLEDNISQKVTENLIKTLTGKSEAGLKNEGLVPPWKQEGRDKPKSYEELADWISRITQSKIESKQQEQQQVQAQQQEQQQQYEKEMTKEYNNMWDNQVKSLQDKNPALKSKEGLRNFWEQLKEYNTQLDSQGQPVIANLAEFYALHYKPFTVQPAGTTAPIAGPNASMPTAAQGEDYSYHDIHGAKSLYDLLPKR